MTISEKPSAFPEFEAFYHRAYSLECSSILKICKATVHLTMSQILGECKIFIENLMMKINSKRRNVSGQIVEIQKFPYPLRKMGA